MFFFYLIFHSSIMSLYFIILSFFYLFIDLFIHLFTYTFMNIKILPYPTYIIYLFSYSSKLFSFHPFSSSSLLQTVNPKPDSEISCYVISDKCNS